MQITIRESAEQFYLIENEIENLYQKLNTQEFENDVDLKED